MELICKKEALREDGTKIMEFTKGKIYDAVFVDFDTDEQYWEVQGDNNNTERFFNINHLFKEQK